VVTVSPFQVSPRSMRRTETDRRLHERSVLRSYYCWNSPSGVQGRSRHWIVQPLGSFHRVHLDRLFRKSPPPTSRSSLIPSYTASTTTLSRLPTRRTVPSLLSDTDPVPSRATSLKTLSSLAISPSSTKTLPKLPKSPDSLSLSVNSMVSSV
jgi:hypothetical protein